MSRKYLTCLIIAVASVILDQVTKILVVQNIRYQVDEIPVFDTSWISLSFVQAQNPGAAFGVMEGQTLFFIGFTVVAVGLLLYMLRELPAEDRFQSAAIGLILSGAVGNVIDRVHKQTVTDFIRVFTEHRGAKSWLSSHHLPNEWPTFNVADSAIVVGLGMFFIHYLFLEKDNADAKPEPPAKPLNEDGSQADPAGT